MIVTKPFSESRDHDDGSGWDDVSELFTIRFSHTGTKRQHGHASTNRPCSIWCDALVPPRRSTPPELPLPRGSTGSSADGTPWTAVRSPLSSACLVCRKTRWCGLAVAYGAVAAVAAVVASCPWGESSSSPRRRCHHPLALGSLPCACRVVPESCRLPA